MAKAANDAASAVTEAKDAAAKVRGFLGQCVGWVFTGSHQLAGGVKPKLIGLSIY